MVKIDKRLELVQQLDKFCEKIGGKWKTVRLEEVENGKIIVRGKVSEERTDCLVVELNNDVHSSKELNGQLAGLPTLSKGARTSGILEIIEGFRSNNLKIMYYNYEFQSYSWKDKDNYQTMGSLNKYNEKRSALETKATKVFSAMNVFLTRTGNSSVSGMFIQDLSHIGHVCMISFKGSIGRYFYKGNGSVEYKVDSVSKKLDEKEYGVVRKLIMEIGDNFPDLNKVILNKETSTLYLYRECGECLICGYLESMGKVHTVRIADIEMLKDMQMG